VTEERTATIGNLPPASRAMSLRDVAAVLTPEDHFLLGVDLVKDVRRLEAAYNDAAGVTATFNLNVLAVLNNELDSNFEFAAQELMRTEISAKFRRAALEAELGAAGLTIDEWWTDPAEDFALLLVCLDGDRPSAHLGEPEPAATG
jgi:L-histidine Nalpha-methyltransferase